MAESKVNKKKYKEVPTHNQLQFIAVIEEKLGIQFEGETKQDAAAFISKNYNIIKRKRKAMRDFWKKEVERND